MVWVQTNNFTFKVQGLVKLVLQGPHKESIWGMAHRIRYTTWMASTATQVRSLEVCDVMHRIFPRLSTDGNKAKEKETMAGDF